METATEIIKDPVAGGSSYRSLVRASAVYDLVVTAPFATPWTLGIVHVALNAASHALGGNAFPEVDVMQVLYANLMGSVVLVWSLLRVVRPNIVYGLCDGIARVLFSTWMLYALMHGAPQVLWLFLAVEITWGVLQLAPWLSRQFRARHGYGSSARPSRDQSR
jgi:hypothetical protein